MIRRWSCIIVTVFSCLFILATSAAPECALVLWVESPAGSDQWSVARVPQPRFTARGDCERQADHLNTFERTVAKMERVSGDTDDVFSCLPCTVDPRPEGALLYDKADPRATAQIVAVSQYFQTSTSLRSRARLASVPVRSWEAPQPRLGLVMSGAPLGAGPPPAGSRVMAKPSGVGASTGTTREAWPRLSTSNTPAETGCPAAITQT
jgi:hypothetical protein